MIEHEENQKGIITADKDILVLEDEQEEKETEKQDETEDFQQYRIRKLTPYECWTLMGFSLEDFLSSKVGSREKAKQLIAEYEPDGHLEMMQYAERKDVSKMSNTQLYKQAGNSIVVDVLYRIYKNLYEVMPYLFDNLKLSSFFSGIGAFESGLNRLYEDVNNQTA